jgi:hypothetical protein
VSRVTLSEPVEICKFWKGRRRDKAVVVTLSTYEQINIVNVREHHVGTDGIMRPTTRGIAMSVKHLGELAAGIAKALVKARALELIDDNEGAGR